MANLISQELFDETILENEECFDLSPEDALRETIDQFAQQLGVVVTVTNANDTATQSSNNNEPSPRSVVAASSTNNTLDSITAAPDEDNNIVAIAIPSALSHLILSHPNSPRGKVERTNRTNFQDSLSILDNCVTKDGTIDINKISSDDDDDGMGCNSSFSTTIEKVTKALSYIGLKCKYGDSSSSSSSKGDSSSSNETKNNSPDGSTLPYLAIFQRTSSIYTLMSFLSIIDPAKLHRHPFYMGLELEDPVHRRDEGGDTDTAALIMKDNLGILNITINTLSSILVINATLDNGQCMTVRSELRDLFIPALGRIVTLIGGIVNNNKTKVVLDEEHSSKSDTKSSPDDIEEEKHEHGELIMKDVVRALCNLLQLATNATRGCEGGKVSFVQSTLPKELSNSSSSNNITTKRGGVAVIISCLSITNNGGSNNSNNNNTRVQTEACNLLASLCRYDDYRDPSTTSSGGGAMAATGVNTSCAHDHAMEFHRAGASTLLVTVARDVLSKMENGFTNEGESSLLAVVNERLAASVLTALRVLAINDDIIQTMVALGVLPIVTKALELGVAAAAAEKEVAAPKRLVAASLGLLRNLCGNDEIKTNLCLGSANANGTCSKSATPSILPHLLKAMQTFVDTAVIQEHACGTLAAMALRRPANARAILDAGGPRFVILAMKRHDDNVNVQRQGALAIRNIVSRLLRDLPDGDADNNNNATTGSAGAGSSSAAAVIVDDERTSIRDAFLELGAEDVLRNIAGRHQGSVDEAYAALRDLGCKVSLVKFNTDGLQQGQSSSAAPMMFGGKHNTNFRAVYEESAGLSNGVDQAVSQFGN